MITIKYFARLSESLGLKQEEVELAQNGASIEALVRLLIARGEPWATEFAADTSVLVALNHEMCQTDARLKPGDEVAFFPPVTGG